MSCDWQQVRIGDLGRVVTGRTPPGNAPDYFGDEIPFLTPSDMGDFRKVERTARSLSSFGAQRLGRCLVPLGVGVSCIGWQMGKAVLIDRPTITNQQINSVVINDEVADSQFVYYALRLRRSELFNLGSGGSRTPILNKGDFERLPFLLPPLPEQRAIASILGALDDKIELNRRMNETLEDLARTIFKSWFVDFDPVRAKAEGRQPVGMDAETAALFPSRFVESELGEIPEGWEVRRVGDEAEVVDYVANGSFASLKAHVRLYDEPGEVLYIRTTDYKSGFSGSLKYTDLSSYEFLRKTKLFGRETIISNVGDTGTVFRPPSWLNLPMTLGSNAIAVRAGIAQAFFHHLFLSPSGQDAIRSIVGGSAQPKFNKTDFRGLRFVRPPDATAGAFERIEEHLWGRQVAGLTETRTLAALRDLLLPKLISGELRVPDAEKLAEAVL